MNQGVAYARNTEGGCKGSTVLTSLVFIVMGFNKSKGKLKLYVYSNLALHRYWINWIELNWTDYRFGRQKHEKKCWYKLIKSYSLFSNSPLCTLFSPQVLPKLLWNTLGNMQTSQEHFTKIGGGGGGTECIMGNWNMRIVSQLWHTCL